MQNAQLLATIVAVLLAASRLATRFRPFWALLPERLRPWAPAVVVITGTLAGVLAGGVDAESAVFDVAVACITAAGLAAPGLPPSDGGSGAPAGVDVSFKGVEVRQVESAFNGSIIAALLAVLVSGALAVVLPACAPSTVQLGADAVKTTCATCRRIAPVCDAVSPAPSGSVQP